MERGEEAYRFYINIESAKRNFSGESGETVEIRNDERSHYAGATHPISNDLLCAGPLLRTHRKKR